MMHAMCPVHLAVACCLVRGGGGRTRPPKARHLAPVLVSGAKISSSPDHSKMKLSVCVLFLGCLVLAAAFPAPREEGLQALRDKLEDLVTGIEALQEAAMEKREQAEEDLLAEDEDLEAEAEEPQEAEMDKRAFNREVYEICEGTCDRRHPLSYSDYDKCEKRCDKLARSSALKTFKVKGRK
ncbi:uncharacterized protein [Branchiostoma lanceolatum]|uniref:uncharacterized protein isoform X1 n=2 Tax=Branchiostoma lanceolatum TaxID=7740 RepID=UPI003452B9C0